MHKTVNSIATFAIVGFALHSSLAASQTFPPTPESDGAITSDLQLKPILGFLPAWSPDGEKIAFSRGFIEYQIYVMNVDGTNQAQLTNNAGDNRGLSWSPDSSKIAFSSTRDHPFSLDIENPARYEIYVINANGSGERRLTNTNAQNTHAAWSPDGKTIVFASNRAGSLSIYRMNTDGSGQVILSGSTGFGDPTWSPDGSRIAMTAGPFLERDIYLMNADGSGTANLTNSPGLHLNLAWSPDGSMITFSSDGGPRSSYSCSGNWLGGSQIYVISVDSSELTQLTNDCDENVGPSWSPDGSKIVFSAGGLRTSSIYVINADGSNKVQMTDVPVF